MKLRYLLLCLPLSGCITAQQALQDLDRAIALAKQISQKSAIAVCSGYQPLATGFLTVAATGEINATTVRDVQVAISILDENCPTVLAGQFNNVQLISNVYAKLLAAAKAARSRQ